MGNLDTRLHRLEAAHRAALPKEQREALETLEALGVPELARELGPAGCVAFLAECERTFADCTTEEVERIANGEEPAAVLGAERAARLSAPLP